MVLPDLPVYVINILSGSTSKALFSSGGTNKVNYLSIKPGLTNTIGSFEFEIPDVSGSLGTAGAFKHIHPFYNVDLALGYTNTGSLNFSGKIETIVSGLSVKTGYTRTFLGSDKGECLTRVLSNRAYVNNSGDTIVQGLRNHCTGSTTGNISTSDTQLSGDSSDYNIVLNNENILTGLKKYSSRANKDIYVDTGSLLRSFTKESLTGSQVFDSGFLEYTVSEDLNPVKNDVYIFGMRNPANISGSDIPTNHDDWTEITTDDWAGSVYYYQGAKIVDYVLSLDTGTKATGSASFEANSGTETVSHLSVIESIITKTVSPVVMLTSGDYIHFYLNTIMAFTGPLYADTTQQIRLGKSTTDYFKCDLEHTSDQAFQEFTIDIGPDSEGVSTPGSINTSTGSYKWERIGDPDWFNINRIVFYSTCSTINTSMIADVFVDGLYFGTKYQSHKSGSNSIQKYGLRKHIESSSEYNSNEYCEVVANMITGSLLEPVTTIDITVTGSLGLSMGSKYSVVIPANDINSYYQLIDLEHIIDTSFRSVCRFTDNSELRAIAPIINYPVVEAEEKWTMWDYLKAQVGRTLSTFPFIKPST